jgi:hypothetical protein
VQNLTILEVFVVFAVVLLAVFGVIAWQIMSLQKELREVRGEYQKVLYEQVRLTAENHWLRIVLRSQNIEIPPLPEDLRPKLDSNGNISILVSGSGGVQVAGTGSVKSGGDVVSRDKQGS